MLGVSKKAAQIGVATVVAGVMLIWVLKSKEFRQTIDGWLGGLGYGLAVVAGWYITAHIGFGENHDTLEVMLKLLKAKEYT